ncbi:MAG: hypothetical protein AMXMBFR84_48410 [Candidatus Hydrogenedentota bacterium]
MSPRRLRRIVVRLLLCSSALALVSSCKNETGIQDRPVSGKWPVRVAVAANFLGPQADIAATFTAKTGYAVDTSSGSTGKLYAQIENGAPFHIFLSADEKHAQWLEERKLAVAGSRFNYAMGTLVLYGHALAAWPETGMDVLRRNDIRHIAIANPDLAPYGLAAMQVLDHLQLSDAVTPKLVKGESIAQAFQFVITGAAEIGFVAKSQVMDKPQGEYREVPSEFHAPILQQAVLLTTAESHPGAAAFLEFLQSPDAREIIRESGYAVPGPPKESSATPTPG